MTPVANVQQALAIVNDALGQLRLTRNEHVRLQQAMDIITTTISKADVPPPTATPTEEPKSDQQE